MSSTALNLRQKTFLYMVMVITTSVVISCNTSSKKQENQGFETVLDQNRITLSKLQFDSGSMELGTMSKQDFNAVVKANGFFAVPPQNQADVSAYFAGYVKDIYLLPGDAVTKGEVLFTIENPEYVQVQQDFLEAKGQLAYLKSNYERQKKLMAENITSQKEFLKAESEYNVTLAQFQSLKKKLHLMNINADQLSANSIQSVIKVLSPLTGFATTVNASKGMYLNPSDVAVTVTNLDQLHLELKIFEKDLPRVQKGQEILLHLQNDNQKIYKAAVHLVNRTVDEEDRTIEIHGDLLNETETHLFAPGMYIEAEIITKSISDWALPNEAIVSIDEIHYVLVKHQETVYLKKQVQIGVQYEGYTQILNPEDFDSDSEFLTVGAFNLITD